MYILYYSTKCENCKKLCSIIKENNIGQIFKYGDIDNPLVKEKKPKQINIIPAIIDTRNDNFYIGKNAFELVYKIIEQKNKQFSSQVSQVKPMETFNNNAYNKEQQQKTTLVKNNINYTTPEVQKKYNNVNQGFIGKEGKQLQEGFMGIIIDKQDFESDIDKILKYSPTEMCKDSACYKFIDTNKDTEIDIPVEGEYYYIQNSTPQIPQPQIQKSQTTQQQQNKMLPSNLQARETKISKAGDMTSRFENFKSQRENFNSNGPNGPIIGNQMGGNKINLPQSRNSNQGKIMPMNSLSNNTAFY